VMLWMPHGNCTHAGDCRLYWQGDWRIQFHANTLTAKVNNARLSDADLACLLTFLNEMLLERTRSLEEESPETYAIDLDISGNYGLTDDGVAGYLVPFLRRWPNCVRLKLYNTSVGDGTLDGLKDWVAAGHVRELHLSHLSGTVTAPAVLRLLRQIHAGGKYPYRCGNGWGRSALWLRLEHNDIANPGEIVQTCQSEGLKVRVLNWTDLQYVRPGSVGKGKGKDGNPSIHLVLFLRQSRRDDPTLESSGAGDLLQMPSSKEAEILSLLQAGNNSDTAAVSSGSNAQERGQKLLSMLKRHGAQASESTSEPQKMSLDEFKLWEMEAREAHELGADLKNHETFGDDVSSGWCFEACVEANERIRRQEASLSGGALSPGSGTAVAAEGLGSLLPGMPARNAGSVPLREIGTSSTPLREVGSTAGSIQRSPPAEARLTPVDARDVSAELSLSDFNNRPAALPPSGSGQSGANNSSPPWHAAGSADSALFQRPTGGQWSVPQQRQQSGKSAASSSLPSSQDIDKSTSSSSAANPQDGSQPLDAGSLNMNLSAIRAMTAGRAAADLTQLTSFVSRCFSSPQFAEHPQAPAAFAPRGATNSAANATASGAQQGHGTTWHGEAASQHSNSARQMCDLSAQQNRSSAPVPWGEQPPAWRNNMSLRQQHQQYQPPLPSEVPFLLDGQNHTLTQRDLAASYAAFQTSTGAAASMATGILAAAPNPAGQQEPGEALAGQWQHYRRQQQLIQDRGPSNRQGVGTDNGDGLTCMMCGGAVIDCVPLSDRRCSSCGACLVRL